jgi:hypothetical protein
VSANGSTTSINVADRFITAPPFRSGSTDHGT